MTTRQLLVVGLSLLPTAAGSQWHLESAVGTMLDDNTFNNSYQISDRITEATLSAGHNWEGDLSLIDVNATGAMNYFAIAPTRTFYSLSTGVDGRMLLDDGGNDLLQATAQVALRSNREEYTLYDHRQFIASLSGRQFVDGALTMKEGYTFRLASFPLLGSLDFAEHTFALQAGTTWSTRTTLIARVEFGAKLYTSPTEDTSASRSSGKGLRSSNTVSPGVSQLVGSLKLAQGITEKTGISLLGQYQGTIAKESRYVSFDTGTLSDDEVFEDRYGYDGPLANLVLTQLVGDDVRLQASLSYQRRLYTLRPALDMDGVTVLAAQRIDERTAISFESQFTLPLGGTTLSLLYEYIVNSSNDPLYRYRNQTLSARVSFAY